MNNPLRDTVRAVRCQCGSYAPPSLPCTKCGAINGPYKGHNPEEPPGAEAALESLRDALEPARQDLREAADAEVDAELNRDAARRKWMLSPECPKAVGPGRTMTVKERDLWVEDKIAAEERTYRLAKAEREAAKAYLDVLGKQLSAQQSVARSVGDSYRSQREPGW